MFVNGARFAAQNETVPCEPLHGDVPGRTGTSCPWLPIGDGAESDDDVVGNCDWLSGDNHCSIELPKAPACIPTCVDLHLDNILTNSDFGDFITPKCDLPDDFGNCFLIGGIACDSILDKLVPLWWDLICESIPDWHDCEIVHSPEPATLAIWSVLGVIGTTTHWLRRRKTL